MLRVDRGAHAAGGQEHAGARPQLDGPEVVQELRDQVAGDDGPREGRRRGARVHHAGPLAELGLGGGVRAEDVRDGGRGQADDGAGEDAEDDDEGQRGGDGVGEGPEDEGEEGGDEGDEAVDVEGAEVVAEVGGGEAAERGGGVHDAEEPEGAHGVVVGCVGLEGPAAGVVFVADARLRGPFFEVEEDGVEAEEEEGDGGAEPAEGAVAEGVRVDPDVDFGPGLGLAEEVLRVGAGNEDCDDAGGCGEGGGVPLGIVEADFRDEEFEHHWVEEACNAGAGSDDADGEALLFPEPRCDD